MALTALTKNKLAKSPATAWLVQPIDTSWIGTFPVKKTTATVPTSATVVPKAPVAPAPVSTPIPDSSWIGTFPAKGTPKNATNPAVPSQTETTPPNPTYTDFSQKTDTVGADPYGFQYNADGSMDTVGMGLESSSAYDARMQYAKYLTELTNYNSEFDPEKKYSELQASEGVTTKQAELDAIDKDVAGQKSAISAIENRARSGYGTLTNDQNSRLIDAESAPSRQVLAQKLLDQEATGQAYNRAKANADTKLNLYTQAVTYKDQQMQKKADLMKQRISALDISDTQKNLMLQKLQIKQQEYKTQTEYARTNGDINSTDPVAKIKAITNAVSQVTAQYKSFPWFIQRPDSVIADAIDTGLATGKYKTLGDAIKAELTDPIMSKPQYAQIQEAMYNTGNKYSTFSNKDASGNETTFLYDTKTGKILNPWDLSATDFRGLAYKYPNEASLKNNNPAGIKSSVSANTKRLLQEAGVQWATGSTPPPDESGRYMVFASVADGMLAHKVLLTQAGTNDVYQRLMQWVGTSEWPNYASGLMQKAGIQNGAKFSDLSDQQLNALISVQMQKESPWFYKELTAISNQKATTPNSTWPLVNGKPLSSDASKLYGYTSTGLRMADQVEKLVDEMGARKFTALYKVGDPAVTSIVSDLADTVGRIRSGGAVNSEEAKRFEDRFVSNMNIILWDTASIKNMLASTRQEFQDTQSAMWVTAGSQPTPTSTPAGTPAPTAGSTVANNLRANLKAKGWDDAKIAQYMQAYGIQ